VFWIVGILVFIAALVFMMALCKAAGDADRRIEEMYREQKARGE